MSVNAPQPSAHDSSGSWLALTATERGAAHHAAGLPNQDAVAAHQLGPDGLVAAVADGHGHHRHFRSARGSALAASVACEAAQELTTRLDEFEAAEQIEGEVLSTLVPAITGRWRAAVGEDLVAEPFTAEEEATRGRGDNSLIAYGSTLLLAIVWRKWLVLAQIGDGDIVGIRPDGRALLAVPGDPSLDGRQTTSLCGPRAEQEFRVAVVDTARTALLGVLLATDGYGNAQVADPWADAVSADLAELIGERGPQWLAHQLPLWVSRCASADGSADDTTIALLIAPSAAAARRLAKSTEPVTVESPVVATRPIAVPGAGESLAERDQRLAEPVPGAGESAAERERRLAKSAVSAPVESPAAGSGDVAAPAPPRPAGWPRRYVVITAVVVLVAVAVVLVVLRMRSPSTASAAIPAACRAPTSVLGKPVTGRATAACDTGTGRFVQVSMTGLPAGKRVALQADGSIFVLVDNRLRWRPITGLGHTWDDLGQVPVGGQQELCVSNSSVIVVADASGEAAAGVTGGPAPSWTQVSVPAKFPVRVGPPKRTTDNLCAGGLSQ